mgnify:CR=1 FL=1
MFDLEAKVYDENSTKDSYNKEKRPNRKIMKIPEF